MQNGWPVFPGSEVLGNIFGALLQATTSISLSIEKQQHDRTFDNEEYLHKKFIVQSAKNPSSSRDLSRSGTPNSKLLANVASLLLKRMNNMSNYGLPKMFAMWPTASLDNSSSWGQDLAGGKLLEGTSEDEEIKDSAAMIGYAKQESLQLNRHIETIIEPKTGTQFPSHLLSNLEVAMDMTQSALQTLAGVGIRSRKVMKLKSINLYAFGFYVQPDRLRASIGEKYATVPFEEIRHHPELYDDLLRHEINMTVRLIVLFKGLSADMVRSAFQVSLKNRLLKIKGVDEDEGLHTFCSYLSGNVVISKGTIIDIHWHPGGKLRTVVDGQELGIISSQDLCRAFFDLYIGDPPVSRETKSEIGESVARILRNTQ